MLADYRIGREIGAGATGRVFEAEDLVRHRKVALKTMRVPAGEAVFRLKREFRVAAHLSHPNLASLHELVLEGELGFFTMELVEGQHFTAFVEASGQPMQALRRTLPGLVAGLHALHSARIIHLDIKPANVLVETDGRVVILDFGFARPSNSRREDAFEQGGLTPAYAPPERFTGAPPDAAGDIYALGVLVFEALTGRRAFEGPLPQMVARKLWKSLPRPSSVVDGVPPELDELVVRSTAVDPALRPRTEELLARFEWRGEDISSRASPPDVFVGRDAELERLLQLADRWRAGECIRVWIRGPAGTGKSALAERAVAAIRARWPDTMILRGRCRPHELVAHNVFDALMDDLVSELASRSADDLAWLDQEEIRRASFVFPVLGELLRDAREPHRSEPAAPLQAVRDLLLRVARHTPICMLADDLQWGDVDSARLFVELFESTSAPLFFVATHRDSAATSESFTSELSRTGALHWVRGSDYPLELGPLGVDDSRALVRGLLGPDASETAVDAVVADSASLPALIHWLVLAGGARTSLQASLDSLSPWQQEVLALLALAGRPLPQRVAARAVDDWNERALLDLVTRGLVHLRRVHPDEPISVAHAWVGERVVEGLDPDRRRRMHQRWAEALEGEDEDAALARHHREAGEAERAARHAARAAARAVRSMAYVTACELFMLALEWAGWSEGERLELTSSLAAALARAGRVAASAKEYASIGRARGDSAALWRAAEQYLAAGFHEEGMALLGPLLRDAGVRVPSSTGRALLGTLRELARSAGTAMQVRRPGPGAAHAIRSVDLCWSATRGLIATDFVNGAYFAAEGLRRSLAGDDVRRAARAMAVVGGTVLGPLGGPLGLLGRQLLARARANAEEAADPYLLGMIAVLEGQLALVEGAFEQALDRSLAGSRLLREHCTGVSFERSVGRMGLLRAAEELGRYDVVRSRAYRYLREAREAGDRYAALTFSFSAAFAALTADDPATAERWVHDAAEEWPRQGFHIQHLYVARALATIALYRGEVEAARATVERMWPELVRSRLLWIPVARIDALALRGRVDLACVDAGERSLLRRARGDAAQLAQERHRHARGIGHLMLASLQEAEGRPSTAAAELEHASRELAAAGARGMQACAELRLGKLRGDGSLISSATEFLDASGVVDPERWARAHAPPPLARAAR